MHYTFGHTDTAAKRLHLISSFFNHLASGFIRSNLDGMVKTAADLGCGPGYTTEMLARATKASKITGIDFSDKFIEMARNQYPDYTFIIQDLTDWNSADTYDVLYCRFLLSHLTHRNQLLHNWAAHLNTGGLLFVDELEDIQTEIPVFRKYLDINSKLVKSQGAELFAGKKLNSELEGLNVLSNQSETIPVPDGLAATWFYPNTVSVWCEEKFVTDLVPENERKEISDELLHLINSADNLSNITWKMKRVIITK